MRERDDDFVDGDQAGDESGGEVRGDVSDDAEDDDLEDDPSLEEDFPRGDGTADTEAVVYCPLCGEPVEIALDPGGGSHQEYVEDCEVCCRPWTVSVRYHADGHADVTATELSE